MKLLSLATAPRALLLALSLLLVAGVARAHQPPALMLVGVGPGDPDLVTLRALHAIHHAHLVFCSNGIQEKFAPYLEGKEVVVGFWRLFPYYGKDLSTLQGDERREAEELDAKRKTFIAKVRSAVAEGKVVAILDNGDPLIYGPWEWCLEEFEDLKPVVVPGVSAFNAGNAALKKGVTTADDTKAVILSSTDWPGKTDTIDKLSATRSTMVLFTMRAELPSFIEKLSVNYPADTPVAIVKHAGYREKQEVVRGTLGTILQQVGDDRLPFEYLIYVGEFLDHRYKPSAQPAAKE